ncbi:phosphatidylserine decarboxylase 1 [Elasticomyces elasticus]|uniref:Phosphatidylserine decarboxylase proenzyme 1, mitochondrial n=1 Tax=Exophiala sideris TaxID=1016849 RepID=A0ABR0JD39_9EURO|nr:phosphatidylserine decarboxylase 1 [Elasticomyces elasticus]KAK5031019.1 phosphatidylserine decarboxylase 1 [Exophiala sideris]KAK5038741.1 phosphatidylserine decarboxylase 1 [Exophiala sideris]KAK5060624.1 phosphatidylserine decarboxylase 1 [Exophiala sideris]KAK5183537.1 phosphatidylserine decarboxylase 1 [Eurotiomycetes sp. CCFEE 6388]
MKEASPQGLIQFMRIRSREGGAQEGDSGTDGGRPPKRQKIYPSGGGWQVQIMSTLPLKAISRIWGRFNEMTIPYYLRVPGFKLYGWIFGVNFEEVGDPDLHTYPNLASFFYRELKPGIRPLDANPNAILSPADAKVLQFGTIENGEVEQVKGMTYSVDALLGKISPQTSPNPQAPSNIFSNKDQETSPAHLDDPEAKSISADQEFANMNGISYTLPNLFSGGAQSPNTHAQDASTKSSASSEAQVSADLATTQPWWSPFSQPSTNNKLYYVVVYLAPGDYHRFHSPANWVCSARRHFAGELYSVSPYVQRILPGLFTLNERVVLLGRWKYGFFSYTAVGATNVGSVVINFDKELRTNSLTTDTEADRQAAAAAERGEPYSGFSEAHYHSASKVLGGHALRRGEEMGGFKLGSSIVLVFEAPAGRKVASLDEGSGKAGELKGGFKWAVERDQKVQFGQALGYVVDED